MNIIWTNKIAVGFQEIDDQHIELFRRINKLYESIEKGKGVVEVENILDFLDEYIVLHFSLEEKYMENFKYPSEEYHKIKHVEFMKNLNQIREKCRLEGPTLQLADQVHIDLADWFVDHIYKLDKDLGKFLSKQKN